MIERVPVLTIAGSDSCGGAGIQADLKTMTALYVYGMSAITALTAQNTLGVQGILPVSADFLGQQLDAICTDIPPEAVKIGMIASPEQVDIICVKIQQYHLKKVVVDPVMVATTGAELTERTTVDAMREQLFAQADLLTPNLSETAVLLGKTVQTVEEMQAAAKQLAEQYQTAVLVKGGHLTEDAIDVLYDGSTMQCFSGARIATKNTHGTGWHALFCHCGKLGKGTFPFGERPAGKIICCKLYPSRVADWTRKRCNLSQLCRIK